MTDAGHPFDNTIDGGHYTQRNVGVAYPAGHHTGCEHIAIDHTHVQVSFTLKGSTPMTNTDNNYPASEANAIKEAEAQTGKDLSGAKRITEQPEEKTRRVVS